MHSIEKSFKGCIIDTVDGGLWDILSNDSFQYFFIREYGDMNVDHMVNIYLAQLSRLMAPTIKYVFEHVFSMVRACT